MTRHNVPSPRTGYYAFGVGLGSWLIHLFIWRMIWRLTLTLWRIPTFGPVLVVLIVIALIGLGVMRSRGGLRLPRRSGGGGYGQGGGPGPRDW